MPLTVKVSLWFLLGLVAFFLTVSPYITVICLTLLATVTSLARVAYYYIEGE